LLKNFKFQGENYHRFTRGIIMTSHHICCSNCGSDRAERHYIQDIELIRTQCPACDYLLVTCAATGRVIESYAPGIAFTPQKLGLGRKKMIES
jgi:hypothetical protein